ncbi:MAG: hypothetical protein MJ168_08025 [Clostridia bacterium]|nr:hypothetical protein [Clostridia bacterium]
MYKKMVIAMICNTLSDLFNEPIVESEIHDFRYDNETHIVNFTVQFWTTHGFEKHSGFICSTGRMNLDGNYLKGSYGNKQY